MAKSTKNYSVGKAIIFICWITFILITFSFIWETVVNFLQHLDYQRDVTSLKDLSQVYVSVHFYLQSRYFVKT